MRAMENKPVKTRFAPSPTGRMHLGNLRTALFNALFARASQGVFLLRSEDTDAARSHAHFLSEILTDLRWLGLHWDEGPEAGGNAGPYLQSERDEVYARHYQRLLDKDLAYPCFCTETELRLERKQALQAGRPPRYSGRCARLDRDQRETRIAAGAAHTLRFRVPAGRCIEFLDLVRGPQSIQSDDIGDFVIRRTDGSPAFFFSNALDDALMGVTHVLRGEDHLTNTPRQLLLLEALELPTPAYGHISLIVDSDGGPLSKRGGSASLASLRERGLLPVAILNHLARLGHHCPNEALLDLDGLAAAFGLQQLGRAPARHDEQQLLHWQKLAVAGLDESALRCWLADWRDERGLGLFELIPEGLVEDFLAAARDNILLPADAVALARAWFDDEWPAEAPVLAEIQAAGATFFEQALAVYTGADQSFGEFSRAVKAATGRNGKALFMPLRAALTHALHGPEMGRVLPLLDASRIRRRLRQAGELAVSAS